MIHFELIVYIIEGKTKVFFIFWKYVDNSVAPGSFVIKLSISIFFENQWWYMLDSLWLYRWLCYLQYKQIFFFNSSCVLLFICLPLLNRLGPPVQNWIEMIRINIFPLFPNLREIFITKRDLLPQKDLKDV